MSNELKMNCDIFIPARLQSTRLPEKHLKKINSIPLIKYLIQRLQTCVHIRHIVVCTTNSTSDDKLVQFLQQENLIYFRGDEKDIIKRLFDAANFYNTDIVIDVEGDDFFTDPLLVDKLALEMKNSSFDFISGNMSTENFDSKTGYPHGLIPVGIRTSALTRIYKQKQTSNTETGYKEFFMNSDLFKIKYLKPEIKHEFSENLRLTIDYEEDLELATKIIKELGNDFHFESLLKLFNQKPELLKIVEPVIEKWKKNYSKNIADTTLNK